MQWEHVETTLAARWGLKVVELVLVAMLFAITFTVSVQAQQKQGEANPPATDQCELEGAVSAQLS